MKNLSPSALQGLSSCDVASNSARSVSIAALSVPEAKYWSQFTSGKPIRVAWAGSCSRRVADWSLGNKVSASKTTRCSGCCQRCAWSLARIAARTEASCVAREPGGGGAAQSARRILDSRSRSDRGLSSVDIVARAEAWQPDCSQVAGQIQRETCGRLGGRSGI